MNITIEEWNRLPWLLSRKTVITVTGIPDEELTKLEIAGTLHRAKTGKRKGRFFKSELAVFCRVGEVREKPNTGERGRC